jgi:5-methylcytosine-specific restriction endonuclease McrA
MSRNYSEEQRAANNARAKAYYSANKTEVQAQAKVYRESHKEEIRVRDRLYYLAHSDVIKDRVNSWAAANPDRRKGIEATAHASNPEKYRGIKKGWKLRNPGKVSADTAKRRALKLHATPPWLSKTQLKQITKIYTEARRLFELDGVRRHVDHIYPLRGKTCSGLHVPWNLQILTKAENLKKNNKLPVSYKETYL